MRGGVKIKVNIKWLLQGTQYIQHILFLLGVVAAEEEDNVLADSLEPGAVAAEERGHDVHEPVAGDELAQAHVLSNPLIKV